MKIEAATKTAPAAAIIGCAGGIAYYLAEALMLRLRIDDAVGAVPVHGIAGVTGILLTGVFAQKSYLTSASESLGIELILKC